MCFCSPPELQKSDIVPTHLHGETRAFEKYGSTPEEKEMRHVQPKGRLSSTAIDHSRKNTRDVIPICGRRYHYRDL
jgi:hypothetical protein